MKANSVLVSVLASSERSGWISPNLCGFLFGLVNAGGAIQREVRLEFMYNIHPVDAARNTIAKNFLESDCEFLCMIDNDAVPPPNLFEMLDRAGEHMDILVPRFHVTLNVMVGHAGPRLDVGVGWQLLDGQQGGGEWRELSLASSHLMFVRRRAFERLQRPFFRFIYDEDGRVRECEDLFFCRKAREAGLRIFGNESFYAEHFKTLPLSLPARSSEWPDLRGVAGRVPALHSKAAAPR